MTQLDSAAFRTQTTALYPDNTTGAISAGDIRAQMNNIADSVVFKATNNTRAPNASDDGANTSTTGNFAVGDIWVDTTADNAYICLDATANAAVWANMSGLTGAEIKAAYEAEADTNAFTDVEKTKLGELNRFLPISTEPATTYTAVIGDIGTYKRMTGATAITFTINNSIFSANDEIIVEHAGAGAITFAAGTGVTLRSANGSLTTATQYAATTIKFISASEAVILGNLT